MEIHSMEKAMNSGRTIFPLWMIAVLSGCLGLALSSTTLLHSQTWEGLNGPPKARDVKDISVNTDGSTIYVCDKSVLFKSTNGGTSWGATGFEIRSPLAVVCKPSTPATIAVGIIDYLRTSNDGGTSFSQISIGSGSEPIRLSVSPVNQNQMYMGRKSLGSSSSILRSMNGGSDWSLPTTFPYGTNINDIAAWPASSNEVWAVGADPGGAAEGSSLSTRGAWRSTDLGVTWTEKGRTQFNLKSVAVKAAGPIVFIGSDVSGKIFSSTNSGTSWSQTTDIGGGVTSIRSLKIRNGSEVWAATNSGIYQSTNNGGSWTNKMSGGDNNFLAFTIASGNQNLMYATTAKTVWKTTNGGTSWTDITNDLGRMPLSSVVSAGNSTTSEVLTASNQYDSTGFYDGYSAWSSSEVPGFYAEHVMRTSTSLAYWAGMLPPNKGALYNGNTTPLCTTAVGTGNIFLGTAVDPQYSDCIYAWGKDGSTNFYRIHNYGAGSKDPFTVGGSSYTVNDVAWFSSSGPTYFALNNNGGVWKCEGGPCGGTQTALTNMSVKSLALNPAVSNVVYAAGTGGLRQTLNGGASWYLRYATDLRKVILSPGYATTKALLILTADGEKILYSSTNGTSWIEVQGNLPKPIRDIIGIAGTPTVVYAATDQGVYRIYGSQSAPSLTSPADEATVGAIPTLSWSNVSGATGYHLLIATDAAFTDVVHDQILTSTTVTLTDLATGTFYWKVASGTFAGAVYSSSRSFTVQAQGTITLSVISFFGTDNKWHPRLSWTHSGQGSNPTFYLYRYSCNYGAGDCGVWPYPFLLSTTATTYDDYSVEVAVKGQTPDETFYYQVRSAGVSNKVYRNAVDGPQKQAVVDPNVPSETKVYHNYPNPFNPITTIKYDLATPGRVSLRVYDVLGEEVAIIVDEIQEAGFKTVDFDASRLPSGVYFYRFSSGLHQSVRKMLFVK
jgi:photosystem II stability/assembly factor-like uncharacterized protein